MRSNTFVAASAGSAVRSKSLFASKEASCRFTSVVSSNLAFVVLSWPWARNAKQESTNNVTKMTTNRDGKFRLLECDERPCFFAPYIFFISCFIVEEVGVTIGAKSLGKDGIPIAAVIDEK
jgi:hypothetical protein